MISLGAVAATAGACVSSLEGEPEPTVAVYSQAAGSCPTNTCGDGNSPVIDGVYFWRMHVGSMPGLQNPEGVQIVGVQKGGVPLRLQVEDGDRFQAVTPLGGIVQAEGPGLIDTRIRVTSRGKLYEIRIAAVQSDVFWVGSPPQQLWAYDFRYRQINDPLQRAERPLCSEGDGDPNKVTALVFAGDLYDPVTKEIEVGPSTDGWLNIACVDSAIYKMEKMGHTAAAVGKGGIPMTSVAQRRALLNMWTANVCGNGESFTKPGVPIRFRDSLALLPSTSPYYLGAFKPLDAAWRASTEAIWSDTGAVCLTKHRLDQPLEPYAVPCRDTLPVCDDLLGDPFAHGHVLTRVP
ncbi:MAG TPA: ADYC domain-containing protein [Kofleriaceae bacterium]|nr:ADYC domain-containing protein [Kofleriaceae bacterium]